MRFNPKSAEEVASGNLWPAGTYDFEVVGAEDAVSKASGADMVKLTLWVFNETGGKITVFDYLVGTDKAQFKVRGFAAAVGLIEAYDAGELDPLDMEGRTGQCKLAIQKDDSGRYGDKNTVAAYIGATPSDKPQVARPKKAKVETIDDEIPF
jgi:hypothetical protein